ncbi:sugar phosphate isomerase/epimerase family protein [Paracnuella aquatica]|uniref:sugar phosphate isomerase/epimerase family protein n=1 Tax=Paracnuella aquatica TaxID=2268757 RepID=UPI000DEFD64D|nr:sugar phosphate isomerase/epimerase family protein [Paracnuella aquatica]RPD50802.1 sugar phosphate isomerase/epimerase [Paracnuella aquatica]
MNRRHLLSLMGAAAATSLLPRVAGAVPQQPKANVFIPCLNMATIRGHNLGFVKELEVASKAGFGAVEIWMDSFQKYLQGGGSTTAANALLKDLGIEVVNSIGFAEWVVDDEGRRKRGIAQLQKEMELLAAIGCSRIAAPPMGAVQEAGLSLQRAAERYRAILELGEQTGVVPHLELWGFAKNLHRLADVAYVAIESGHPQAKVLLDVYHLYKGGSAMETLPLISAGAVEIFHVNDYPLSIKPADITDGDRVYPGMGEAPILQQLQALRHPDRPLIVSVEVFNKGYYGQDPLTVAKTAFAQIGKITAGVS